MLAIALLAIAIILVRFVFGINDHLGLSASLVAAKNLRWSPSFHCHKRIIGLHRTRADEEARVDRRKWECDHGPYRGYGCRNLFVYCSSGRCHHSATMNGNWLPDDLPVRSLCGHMVCTRCGYMAPTCGRIWDDT